MSTKPRRRRKAPYEPGLPVERGERSNRVKILDQLWQAAVALRGSIEPSDYKRYVLPLVFLRFLSLKYERRRGELAKAVSEPKGSYYTRDPKVAEQVLNDPDEYRSVGPFVIPEESRWDFLLRKAQRDDIKKLVDNALEALEETYPDKLRLPDCLHAR